MQVGPHLTAAQHRADPVRARLPSDLDYDSFVKPAQGLAVVSGEVTLPSDTHAVLSWPSRFTNVYPVSTHGRMRSVLLSRIRSPRLVRTISTAWPSPFWSVTTVI